MQDQIFKRTTFGVVILLLILRHSICSFRRETKTRMYKSARYPRHYKWLTKSNPYTLLLHKKYDVSGAQRKIRFQQNHKHKNKKDENVFSNNIDSLDKHRRKYLMTINGQSKNHVEAKAEKKDSVFGLPLYPSSEHLHNFDGTRRNFLNLNETFDERREGEQEENANDSKEEIDEDKGGRRSETNPQKGEKESGPVIQNANEKEIVYSNKPESDDAPIEFFLTENNGQVKLSNSFDKNNAYNSKSFQKAGGQNEDLNVEKQPAQNIAYINQQNSELNGIGKEVDYERFQQSNNGDFAAKKILDNGIKELINSKSNQGISTTLGDRHGSLPIMKPTDRFGTVYNQVLGDHQVPGNVGIAEISSKINALSKFMDELSASKLKKDKYREINDQTSGSDFIDAHKGLIPIKDETVPALYSNHLESGQHLNDIYATHMADVPTETDKLERKAVSEFRQDGNSENQTPWVVENNMHQEIPSQAVEMTPNIDSEQHLSNKYDEYKFPAALKLSKAIIKGAKMLDENEQRPIAEANSQHLVPEVFEAFSKTNKDLKERYMRLHNWVLSRSEDATPDEIQKEVGHLKELADMVRLVNNLEKDMLKTILKGKYIAPNVGFKHETIPERYPLETKNRLQNPKDVQNILQYIYDTYIENKTAEEIPGVLRAFQRSLSDAVSTNTNSGNTSDDNNNITIFNSIKALNKKSHYLHIVDANGDSDNDEYLYNDFSVRKDLVNDNEGSGTSDKNSSKQLFNETNSTLSQDEKLNLFVNTSASQHSPVITVRLLKALDLFLDSVEIGQKIKKFRSKVEDMKENFNGTVYLPSNMRESLGQLTKEINDTLLKSDMLINSTQNNYTLFSNESKAKMEAFSKKNTSSVKYPQIDLKMNGQSTVQEEKMKEKFNNSTQVQLKNTTSQNFTDKSTSHSQENEIKIYEFHSSGDESNEESTITSNDKSRGESTGNGDTSSAHNSTISNNLFSSKGNRDSDELKNVQNPMSNYYYTHELNSVDHFDNLNNLPTQHSHSTHQKNENEVHTMNGAFTKGYQHVEHTLLNNGIDPATLNFTNDALNEENNYISNLFYEERNSSARQIGASNNSSYLTGKTFLMPENKNDHDLFDGKYNTNSNDEENQVKKSFKKLKTKSTSSMLKQNDMAEIPVKRQATFDKIDFETNKQPYFKDKNSKYVQKPSSKPFKQNQYKMMVEQKLEDLERQINNIKEEKKTLDLLNEITEDNKKSRSEKKNRNDSHQKDFRITHGTNQLDNNENIFQGDKVSSKDFYKKDVAIKPITFYEFDNSQGFTRNLNGLGFIDDLAEEREKYYFPPPPVYVDDISFKRSKINQKKRRKLSRKMKEKRRGTAFQINFRNSVKIFHKVKRSISEYFKTMKRSKFARKRRHKSLRKRNYLPRSKMLNRKFKREKLMKRKDLQFIGKHITRVIKRAEIERGKDIVIKDIIIKDSFLRKLTKEQQQFVWQILKSAYEQSHSTQTSDQLDKQKNSDDNLANEFLKSFFKNVSLDDSTVQDKTTTKTDIDIAKVSSLKKANLTLKSNPVKELKHELTSAGIEGLSKTYKSQKERLQGFQNVTLVQEDKTQLNMVDETSKFNKEENEKFFIKNTTEDEFPFIQPRESRKHHLNSFFLQQKELTSDTLNNETIHPKKYVDKHKNISSVTPVNGVKRLNMTNKEEDIILNKHFKFHFKESNNTLNLINSTKGNNESIAYDSKHHNGSTNPVSNRNQTKMIEIKDVEKGLPVTDVYKNDFSNGLQLDEAAKNVEQIIALAREITRKSNPAKNDSSSDFNGTSLNTSQALLKNSPGINQFSSTVEQSKKSSGKENQTLENISLNKSISLKEQFNRSSSINNSVRFYNNVKNFDITDLQVKQNEGKARNKTQVYSTQFKSNYTEQRHHNTSFRNIEVNDCKNISIVTDGDDIFARAPANCTREQKTDYHLNSNKSHNVSLNSKRNTTNFICQQNLLAIDLDGIEYEIPSLKCQNETSNINKNKTRNELTIEKLLKNTNKNQTSCNASTNVACKDFQTFTRENLSSHDSFSFNTNASYNENTTRKSNESFHLSSLNSINASDFEKDVSIKNTSKVIYRGKNLIMTQDKISGEHIYIKGHNRTIEIIYPPDGFLNKSITIRQGKRVYKIPYPSLSKMKHFNLLLNNSNVTYAKQNHSDSSIVSNDTFQLKGTKISRQVYKDGTKTIKMERDSAKLSIFYPSEKNSSTNKDKNPFMVLNENGKTYKIPLSIASINKSTSINEESEKHDFVRQKQEKKKPLWNDYGSKNGFQINTPQGRKFSNDKYHYHSHELFNKLKQINEASNNIQQVNTFNIPFQERFHPSIKRNYPQISRPVIKPKHLIRAFSTHHASEDNKGLMYQYPSIKSNSGEIDSLVDQIMRESKPDIVQSDNTLNFLSNNHRRNRPLQNLLENSARQYLDLGTDRLERPDTESFDSNNFDDVYLANKFLENSKKTILNSDFGNVGIDVNGKKIGNIGLLTEELPMKRKRTFSRKHVNKRIKKSH